jgi:hypothetical protein
MENRGVSTPDFRTPTVRFVIGPESGTWSQGKSPPSDNLDADHDDETPLRYRKLTDILGLGTPPGFAAREAIHQLFLAEGDAPTNFKQAEQHPSWRSAMIDEIRSIEENNTCRLVDLPAGHKPIGLKWVFKLKKDHSGAMVKHKARHVAKGHA